LKYPAPTFNPKGIELAEESPAAAAKQARSREKTVASAGD